MSRFSNYLTIVVSALTLPTSLLATGSERPNVLFILCDDLGYGDVGIFYQNSRKEGQPSFKTPHIDQLAKDGIQLRAHYAPAPVCAPSRASLFLGQHQGNAPIRDNQFDKALPDQPTLASTLNQAGYHTGLIGKWGLQGKGKSPEQWPSYPTKRGFDFFFGYVTHVEGHEHYPHENIHMKKRKKTTKLWEMDKEISAQLKGCYTTDLFTAVTKRFLVSHQKQTPEKPFFLVLSYDTPHAATQVATSPYPKGFGVNGGVQWIGKPGEMINTTKGEPNSFIHPDYEVKSWKDVSKRYASSIRRIDNSVGDIVQTLKDLKLDNNTLIVFTSDHGPSQESYIRQRLDPSVFQSFGPFTGVKRDCWEGGIRPGAIATWPAKIKAGSITESPSQMHDWMPTFCEVANTSIPAIADGVSLIPTLIGAGTQQPSTIYIEYNVGGKTPNYKQYPKARRGQKRQQMQVVREGDLKAIRYNIKAANDPFLVFDLSKDPAEKTNLAGKSGIPTQQHWLDAVSRLHHVNRSARRPYDDFPIASVKGDNLKIGFKITEATPDAKSSYLSRDSHKISGYLKVNEAGKYTFALNSSINKGILRIHSINVLDTASKEAYPNNNTLNLKKGLHPFTLYLTENPHSDNFLLWKKQNDEKFQEIPSTEFRRPASAKKSAPWNKKLLGEGQGIIK